MADEKKTPMTANYSLSQQPRRQQPLSLNQRHTRILSDLSTATIPKHITKMPSETNDADEDGGQGRLHQPSGNDDVPSFCGIADFESPSPPPHNPYPVEDARIQAKYGVEEVVGTDSDCDSSPPFPSGEGDKMHTTKGLSISGKEECVQNLQGKEDKVLKVRIEGRRRLCKIANKNDNCAMEVNQNKTDADGISEFDSPGPLESNYSRDCVTDIRDILNDLTSKFDILSIEKPRKPERIDLREEFQHLSETEVDRVKETEGIPEYGSAASAFSVLSDASSGSDKDSTVVNVPFTKPVKKYYADDGSEDEIFHGEENKSKKFAVGKKVDAIKRTTKLISTHSTTPIDLDKRDEDDDDDCILMDEVVATSGFEKVKVEGSKSSYKVDEEDGISDDFVLEQEDSLSLGRKPTFRLQGKISKILFPHQRDGLKWLWSLHCKGKGGVLGDDMGLGKTMQFTT